MSKNFIDIKTKTFPDSEVEITGAITLPFLLECRKEAIKELNNKTNLPGFRPGHIPEDVLVKRLGELAVLEESAEIALAREFSLIIKEAKVSAIGRPSVSITKLAPGIPLEFKITTAVEPEFILPDYKKIAKEIIKKNSDPKEEVTDKEVADVIAEVEKHNIKPELKEGEKLEDKIKENIIHEKKFRNKEKIRIEILEALIKGTEIKVPKVLVEEELLKMMGQFKDDVARAGLKWEDYLKSIKKDEEVIKEEWKDKAFDRAKAELIVTKIAIEEKIEPTAEEVEHEVKHVLSHYPDAEPLRAHIYVYTMMRNEKVLEFLENLG